MKKWFHKIEVLVDKSIPYMLVLLLGIIVVDLGFHEFAEHYHNYILFGDGLVIFIFVLDLIFKYNRIREIKNFLRSCWLDIIAVFPFFLFFRLFEEFAGWFKLSMGEGFSTAQSILHEGVELEKEGAKLLEGVEKGAKTGRTTRFARFIRPVFRAPRFAKAISFFKAPEKKEKVKKSYTKNKRKKVKKDGTKKIPKGNEGKKK